MTATSTSKKDSDSLLFVYRPQDSLNGVTRATAKRLSAQLGMTETGLLHFALARLAQEILPMYEPDDGPLTQEQVTRIQQIADEQAFKGPTISRRSLMPE